MILSASTNLKRPETQSWDTLLMYINLPTLISINPSVLLYFSLQLGWCKVLWMAVLNVWSWCQTGLVPGLSLSLSSLNGGMYRKIEPRARKANGCIPPSDIYLHSLSPFPSLVLSLSCSLFLFCHWVLHSSNYLDFPFSYFTHFFAQKSYFPLMLLVSMPSIMQCVTNYFPIILNTSMYSHWRSNS